MPTQINETYFDCPRVSSLDGHGFSARQLAKLGGIPIQLTRIQHSEDNQVYAVFNVSRIIAALQGQPAQLYWKGYYNSLQPKSYGIRQEAPIDPELHFLVGN